MKKKLTAAAVLLMVVGLAAVFFGLIKPSSRALGEVLADGSVELLPPQSVAPPVNASTGSVAPLSRGKAIRIGKSFLGTVQVNSVPGGTGNSLTVFFQTSGDNGQNWFDFANVTLGTNFSGAGKPNAIGTYLVPMTTGPDNPWSGVSAPLNASIAGDGTLGASAINFYPIGGLMRIKYNVTGGAAPTGTYSFHVAAKVN